MLTTERRPLHLFILLALAAISLPSCCHGEESAVKSGSDVIVLTDENFDALTANGQWMIEIYAPWCVHCKALTPTWEQLATKLKSEGIKVAKIDGVEQKVLLSRFRVEGFPSIFHVADGETREYSGTRTLQALETFATRGWKLSTPLPFWRSPTSPAGQVLAYVYGLPSWLQSTYTHLNKDLGYSELTILAGTLAIPLAIGIVFICTLDIIYTSGGTYPVPVAHEHRD